MFKFKNKDTRTTPEHIFTPCSSVSIVNFEQANAYWVDTIPETFPNFTDPSSYLIFEFSEWE